MVNKKAKRKEDAYKYHFTAVALCEVTVVTLSVRSMELFVKNNGEYEEDLRGVLSMKFRKTGHLCWLFKEKKGEERVEMKKEELV